jgi:hypothetical protein
LTSAHSREESSNSTGALSQSPNLLAILLALQVVNLDFQEVKTQLPASRITSSNGKIYWCAEFPGKLLAIEGKKILVDGVPLEKLLAAGLKSTGGK